MVLQHELCLGKFKLLKMWRVWSSKVVPGPVHGPVWGGSLPSSEDFVFSLTMHKILHSSSVRGAGSRALECQG